MDLTPECQTDEVDAAIARAVAAARGTTAAQRLSVAVRRLGGPSEHCYDFDIVTDALANLLREAAAAAKPGSALNLCTRSGDGNLNVEITTVLRRPCQTWQPGLESAIARTLSRSCQGEVAFDLPTPQRLRTILSLPAVRT
jgi:hypothetical protein